VIAPDELAAVIAALQAASEQPEEAPQHERSAWKRAARLEAVGADV
jgi:hypothetical protein